MGALEDILHIVELALIVVLIYQIAPAIQWLVNAISGAGKAVGETISSIGKAVGEAVRTVTSPPLGEVVQKKEYGSIDEIRMDCLSYVKNVYMGGRWDYEVDNAINEFCRELAEAALKLAVKPSEAYEMLYSYYSYYLSAGYDWRQALLKALDKMIGFLKQLSETKVEFA